MNTVRMVLNLGNLKNVWSPIWGLMNRGWSGLWTDLPFWNDHPAYDVTAMTALWQLNDDVRRVWQIGDDVRKDLERAGRH